MAEPTQAQIDHYGDLFANARDEIIALWDVALTEWDVFKFGREKFGVPLTDSVWTAADMQESVNLQQMVKIADAVVLDVLSGRRKLMLDAQLGLADVEALASDQFLLRLVGGKAVLVDAKAPAAGAVDVNGQLGGWHIAVAALIVTAILGYNILDVIKKKIQLTIEKLRAATQTDLQTKCGELVAAGTYKADECTNLVKEIQNGQAAILKADTENKAAEPTPVTDAIKTGMYVVLGLAALGVGLYAFQTLAPPRRAAMANPAPTCSACHRQMAPHEVGDEMPEERVCDQCAGLDADEDGGEPPSREELYEGYVIQDARHGGYTLHHEGRTVGGGGDWDDVMHDAVTEMGGSIVYGGLYYVNERGNLDELDEAGNTVRSWV